MHGFILLYPPPSHCHPPHIHIYQGLHVSMLPGVPICEQEMLSDTYFTSPSSGYHSNHYPLLFSITFCQVPYFSSFALQSVLAKRAPALCGTSAQLCPFSPFCQFPSGQGAKTACISIGWGNCLKFSFGGSSL